jgi:hypothetical protein
MKSFLIRQLVSGFDNKIGMVSFYIIIIDYIICYSAYNIILYYNISRQMSLDVVSSSMSIIKSRCGCLGSDNKIPSVVSFDVPQIGTSVLSYDNKIGARFVRLDDIISSVGSIE